MTTDEAAGFVRIASESMDFNQVMIIVANAGMEITFNPDDRGAWTCKLNGRDSAVLRKGATPLEAARRALRSYYLTEAISERG